MRDTLLIVSKFVIRILVLLLLLLTSVASATPRSMPSFTLLHVSVADTSKVLLKYPLLIVGQGTDLVIFDVSNPSNPTELSRITLSPSLQSSVPVALYKNDVIVDTGDRGLRAVDITDPTRPSLGAEYPGQGLIEGAEVRGDLLYLTGLYTGFSIIDLTKSGDEAVVDRLSENAQDLAIVNTTAYITGGGKNFDELVVADISNPQKTTITARYNLPSQGGAIKVVGDIAYVGYGFGYGDDLPNGIAVFDIAEPTIPTLISTIATSGQVYEIQISGNTMYAIAQGQGPIVLDLNDPKEPRILGFPDLFSRQFIVNDDLLYSVWDTFSIYQISQSTQTTTSIYLPLMTR